MNYCDWLKLMNHPALLIHSYAFGQGAGKRGQVVEPFFAAGKIIALLNSMGYHVDWEEIIPKSLQKKSFSIDCPHKGKEKKVHQLDSVVQAVTLLAKKIAASELNPKHDFKFTIGGDHTQGLASFKGFALAHLVKSILNGRTPLLNRDINTIDLLKTQSNEGDIDGLLSTIQKLIDQTILPLNVIEATLNDLHLLWFDAHADYNTPETSPSGHAHGMPLACITGRGEPALTKLFAPWLRLKPSQIDLIGVRDIDPEEARLLELDGVRIHGVNAIKESGLKTILESVMTGVHQAKREHPPKILLSFDLDGIDAAYVPATGTPVGKEGPLPNEVLAAFSAISRKVDYLELSEAFFEPNQDKNNQTLTTLLALIQTFFEPLNQTRST